MPGSHSSSSEYSAVHGYSAVRGAAREQRALMIFDRHANRKYKYGSRNFWYRGYVVDTVGKNAKIVQEYIQNQLVEDLASGQISLKEYMDLFTGSKRK